MSDTRDRLQETAEHIKATLPPGTGFILLAFDFGPSGRLEYIANAHRDDAIEAMKEFISRSTPDNFGVHVPDKIPLVTIENLATDLQKAIGETGHSIDRRPLIELLKKELK